MHVDASSGGEVFVPVESSSSAEPSPTSQQLKSDSDSLTFPGERRPSSIARRQHNASDPIELLKKKLEAASYGFNRDWFKM